MIILVAGIISGISNTVLIATINSVLNRTGAPTSAQVLAFGGLCLVLASMRFVSGAVLVLLMKKVTVSLRLQLLLLGALVFMVIGIISHQLPVKKALKYFERARETTDAL